MVGKKMMRFLRFLFGAERAEKSVRRRQQEQQQQVEVIHAVDKFRETLVMLEKKEELFRRKYDEEILKARKFVKEGNKKAAMQCLKRKALYEKQIESLGNYQLRIHDQMIMVEGAATTTTTIEAMNAASEAMRVMQRRINIDDVDRVIEGIRESEEDMRMVQEALSVPLFGTDIDEDELQGELDGLEELLKDEDDTVEGQKVEQALLNIGTSLPPLPVVTEGTSLPPLPVVTEGTSPVVTEGTSASPPPEGTEETSAPPGVTEQQELRRMQAEMAM